ncbi:unnamed protein product, partial [Ixodes pacificus]
HTRQKPGKRKCQPVNCRVDTGADCCDTSERLLHTLTKRPARECSVRLSSFFGHVQSANGKSTLHVQHKGCVSDVDFYVVKQDVPTTLSGVVSEELQLLRQVAPL